jgi:hypothetical protein
MSPDMTLFGIDTATWTVYAAVFITTLLLAVCGACSVLEGDKQTPSLERKQAAARRTAV